MFRVPSSEKIKVGYREGRVCSAHKRRKETSFIRSNFSVTVCQTACFGNITRIKMTEQVRKNVILFQTRKLIFRLKRHHELLLALL